MSAFQRRNERPVPRGARAARPGPIARLRGYFTNHAQVLVSALGRLYASPLSSLMTAAVIGIALALPTGMYVLLQNLQAVSGGWDNAAQISVFLKMNVTDQQAEALGQKLTAQPEVASVRTLTHAQALKEFQDLSGFGDALKVLDDNPLPAVLVVRPNAKSSTPDAANKLLEKLRALPETDQARLDLLWVERLYTMMAIGRRAVLVIAALLGLAVLLAVGNTIRLDIQNRRDEIVITKLIGATNPFIRRPFLYSGLWFGLFGGIIAWVLLAIALGLLSGPVHRLAGLYGSDFTLLSLNAGTVAVLLGSSILLGLGGSWLAVSRHLSDIEPT